MNSKELRQSFLNFFEEKGHKIIPSAPIVVKNDPTLMFTNAGMNQFKNVFLGNSPSNYTRIANSLKMCSITLPCPTDLPIGLMICMKKNNDEKLINLAEVINNILKN